MTHEESKVLWKLEKIGFEAALEADRYKKLVDAVDPLIESDKLSYDEFMNTFANFFEEVINEHKTVNIEETAEVRKAIIDKIINLTIEKYEQQR